MRGIMIAETIMLIYLISIMGFDRRIS